MSNWKIAGLNSLGVAIHGSQASMRVQFRVNKVL